MPPTATAVEIGLSAAIVAVVENDPLILCAPETSASALDGLPFGPFDPLAHRTLETGLRAWVSEQTRLKLGYVEQLYTFGDRGRYKTSAEDGAHVVSVGYLALTRAAIAHNESPTSMQSGRWRAWYGFLPWEDWRGGKPTLIDEIILPALSRWAKDREKPAQAEPPMQRLLPRLMRLRLAFGLDGVPWDEERVLERYELLYEAGLVEEAFNDGNASYPPLSAPLGRAMAFDHRRILATAIARLRGKLKYRPVIFELMPPSFTLTALQETVEAISGRHLHKQNFRRLVESAELVEPTGATLTQPRGRPAALYRFRHEVLEERPAPGLRVGVR
ncbi:NAD regulator [Phyllobacterium phragmitis]|uniref:NAD regulator n=1 Tax=Phyllobacterium phragmitis TaxID=2670329 RepID=A0A2S9IZB2_9HYPH|nr:NAD regulator [Phyllobacterium phragmitis]PRD45867.1 NAD regulator [Phyllobacterium phragmitis]